MKILVVSGSLRRESYNSALARAAAELAPRGVEIELYDGLGEVPLFDDDIDGENAPRAVIELRERIAGADAVFIVTPEYNGSVPGVLKNAIDWASRPPRGEAALWGKTVAIAGASTGQYGAMWAQQDLRRILGIAGARVIAGEVPVARAHEKFDEDGALIDAPLQERLGIHLGALVAEAAPLLVAA
jgi:chromate reductase